MRALILVVAVATPAYADEAVWSGSVGVGAGLAGIEPVSAAEVRGDLAWDGGAVGLGARVRVVGDEIATSDWDEVADWLAVLRYLVLRDEDDRSAARLGQPARWRAAFAAGRLGAVRVGPLVDGLITDAIAERPATGAHVRVGYGDVEGELAIADVARGGVVAAAGRGPVGPLEIGASAAVDPRAPRHVMGTIEQAPLAAVEAGVGYGDRRRSIAIDAGWEPGLGAGAAIVARGATRLGERVQVRGEAELGVGSDGWIAAPFGPLYLRQRDVAGPMETLVDRARAGDLGGVDAAGELAIDVDDLGAASVGVRRRPGLGVEIDGRAALPALRGVQAAAVAAWSEDALLVGGEAHAELGRAMWSGLELARQYRPGDTAGLYAERPVWQVTAWFGFAR